MSDAAARRAAAVFALAAAASFFAYGLVEAGAVRSDFGRYLIAAQSLLLIPVAMYLWRWLRARSSPYVALATLAGIASLLLWGTAPFTHAWQLEWVWIALSAVWWIVLGGRARRLSRRWGWFTVVLGVAAVADAAVTAAEANIPEWVYGAVGGWKLPLSLIWMIWTGIALLRGRIGAPTPDAGRGGPMVGSPPTSSSPGSSGL